MDSFAPPQEPATAWPVWLRAAAPKLLYGAKLAAAVAAALLIAFYLELDNPSWAGTSAGIVCQPILGASLRKGFFRAVGTVTGAVATVLLTGLFPQDRIGFLVGMALWVAACSFGNTLTRNFSAYALALSGYTLAIIAGDSISDPGQAFHLSITRAAEIIIGIVCAVSVTSLTELGGSRARLAAGMDAIGREILAHFSDLLHDPARHAHEGPDARRALIARVGTLDPVMDQAVGEDAELRQRAAILRDAMSGFFAALSGWRLAESHLANLEDDHADRCTRDPAACLPDGWQDFGPSPTGADAADAVEPDVEAACRDLAEDAPRHDVSRRIVADAVAKVSLGLGAGANGLALLRDPGSARDVARSHPFLVADYLPAVVNAIRTFTAVSASVAFWVATEWPQGLDAVTFVAVSVVLMAPQQEKSAKASLGFAIGTVLTAALAAVCKFAVLPAFQSFPALACGLAIFLVPLAALSTVPALAPYFVAATMNFMPLVSPSNLISYDTLAFYNGALGIVGGCLAASLFLVLIPPVPKPMRADRLVALTLRDMHRIAGGRWRPSPSRWQAGVYARLVAMPEGVDPLQGARLVAALSMGLQALRLRALAARGPDGDWLRAGLQLLAVGDVDGMLAAFDAADAELPSEARHEAQVATAIQIVRDVVRQHGHEFQGTWRA